MLNLAVFQTKNVPNVIFETFETYYCKRLLLHVFGFDT